MMNTEQTQYGYKLHVNVNEASMTFLLLWLGLDGLDETNDEN